MPPPRADYHMHSRLSCDGHDTMEAMCQASLDRGFDEVAITEHLDLHPLDECPGFLRPHAYFAELARCREEFAGRLAVRAGIEVGDCHRFSNELGAVVRAWPYDFAIGSVHFIDDEAPFGRPFFLRHDGDWAYSGYFREMSRLVEADHFDVVGHIDLIKREGTEFYGRFDPTPYADILRSILRRLIERGKGIEINTSGIRRAAAEPCPGLTMLRWYAELGGEILTIGSDSHRIAHAGHGYDEGLALAQEAGLRWLTTFEGRRPIQHPLR